MASSALWSDGFEALWIDGFFGGERILPPKHMQDKFNIYFLVK